MMVIGMASSILACSGTFDTGSAAIPADAGEDGTTGRDAGAMDGSRSGDAARGPETGIDGSAGIDANADAATEACSGEQFPGSGSASSKTQVSGQGFINIFAPPPNRLVGLVTTLVVPEKPPALGTLFLWPGIQPSPDGRNFGPIDNGVLQPVLTWGPTCAPNAPSEPYAAWWVSAQYVNTYGKYQGYTGCLGGEGMVTTVGDELVMEMTLEGDIWKQVVKSRRTNTTVDFSIDMLGQDQNYGEFVIEPAGQNPISTVVFTSTVLTFASPAPAACEPLTRGARDTFTAPRASADGKRCCIERMVLSL